MPSWNIHLAVGEKVNQKLRFTGKQRDNFLLGCLLPDINNGYVNHVGVVKKYEETHWVFNQQSVANFLAKYRQEIERREPIYMGYLLHLYTDEFFNRQFGQIIKESQFAKMDFKKLLEIKHNDFWKYDIKHDDLKFNVDDKKAACELANEIENIEITEDDIATVEQILESKILSKKSAEREYILYTEADLDRILDQAVAGFSEEYL